MKYLSQGVFALCLISISFTFAVAQSPRYTLQVEAATDLAVALTTVKRLQAAGLAAYWIKARLQDRDFYRVRVGSFDTADKARAVARELIRAGLVKEFFVAREEAPVAAVRSLPRFQLNPPLAVLDRAQKLAHLSHYFPNLTGKMKTSAARPQVPSDEHPRAELFVGYSYLRTDTTGLGFSLNGWNGSVAGNFNRWFGLVADFSGHYISTSSELLGTSIRARANLHSFLFGPRFSYRTERVTPFAHVLFGVVRGRASGSFGGSISSDTDVVFGMAAGGGVDLKMNERVSIRALQFDYFLTRFAESNQHNLRFSSGFVFR
jgi:opacity protein-like surface antigen